MEADQGHVGTVGTAAGIGAHRAQAAPIGMGDPGRHGPAASFRPPASIDRPR
jgi:hypothetical protein